MLPNGTHGDRFSGPRHGQLPFGHPAEAASSAIGHRLPLATCLMRFGSPCEADLAAPLRLWSASGQSATLAGLGRDERGCLPMRPYSSFFLRGGSCVLRPRNVSGIGSFRTSRDLAMISRSCSIRQLITLSRSDITVFPCHAGGSTTGLSATDAHGTPFAGDVG
jgi:hypothetical protein